MLFFYCRHPDFAQGYVYLGKRFTCRMKAFARHCVLKRKGINSSCATEKGTLQPCAFMKIDHPPIAKMSACYCTYLFVSLVVGQVIGSGIVVVTGTRVSSASHQQGLDDGGVARGGGLVERSSVVLSCSVHLSPSVEIGRNDATRLTFYIRLLM